jgi:hypothetical protein
LVINCGKGGEGGKGSDEGGGGAGGRGCQKARLRGRACSMQGTGRCRVKGQTQAALLYTELLQPGNRPTGSLAHNTTSLVDTQQQQLLHTGVACTGAAA